MIKESEDRSQKLEETVINIQPHDCVMNMNFELVIKKEEAT